MYNTQSSGSPIPDYCKTGRKITETPYYAAGLGKSAPLLGSSWENEAYSASQPCAGEPGSGCWDWTKERLEYAAKSTAGLLDDWPHVQKSLYLTRTMNTEAEAPQICRKITNSRDFNPKYPSFLFFFFLKSPLLKSYHYMGISLLL